MLVLITGAGILWKWTPVQVFQWNPLPPPSVWKWQGLSKTLCYSRRKCLKIIRGNKPGPTERVKQYAQNKIHLHVLFLRNQPPRCPSRTLPWRWRQQVSQKGWKTTTRLYDTTSSRHIFIVINVRTISYRQLLFDAVYILPFYQTSKFIFRTIKMVSFKMIKITCFCSSTKVHMLTFQLSMRISLVIQSFSILSDDRSKASSKTIPPHSAI